ncbi:DUF1523 family protein [Histophilus somni]|uniref:DUF1523 family protein n=1 Tax=Histophilus somni TaxID=731 RepID=A0A9Q6P4I9_HISSO|nr:DUF1523 family protein [Histophilus somni]ACA32166.1 protein of unknown function DUF1523 [Histophilus somni 2336]ARU65509.1 hypothetical protein BTV18_08390 [Histophilus somni]ARU67378.1 hypothetical protein BTV19_08830 [Histophilus somni]ARU69259.1 hypothetical protein BTV16_08845 [Histophilus somni]ARU71136.1 hypothetical protein BTV20_08850 [Histophilus somni]
MRKIFKKVVLGLLFLFHVFLFSVVHYVTPHYDVTKVTGVEVKRVDKDGPITKANPADGPTRDVYYIYTQKPNEENVMVYRNEDTRWSFPFYFKFGSADLQAKAQSFSVDHKLVEIKYYGWRLVMFDEFRNAVSVKEVSADTEASHSILAYVFYAFLLITLFFSIQFVRGWFDSED